MSFCHLVASRHPGRARCTPVPRGPWHRPQEPEPEPERASPLARERPGADPATPDLVSQARGKGRPHPRAAEVRGARRAGGGRAGSRRCVPGAFGEPPGGRFSSEPAGPRPGPGKARAWRGGERARAPCGGREGMPCACALRGARACVCACACSRARNGGAVGWLAR